MVGLASRPVISLIEVRRFPDGLGVTCIESKRYPHLRLGLFYGHTLFEIP